MTGGGDDHREASPGLTIPRSPTPLRDSLSAQLRAVITSWQARGGACLMPSRGDELGGPADTAQRAIGAAGREEGLIVTDPAAAHSSCLRPSAA